MPRAWVSMLWTLQLLCGHIDVGRDRHGALISHWNTCIRCSEMAHARPKPSYVDVPRPSSSMMTSELLVAPCAVAVTPPLT